MPLYDFRCTQCEHQFTVRASFKEKDAGLSPECPVCHELETQQVLTSGIFIGQGASGGKLSMPAIRRRLDSLGVQPNADRR